MLEPDEQVLRGAHSPSARCMVDEGYGRYTPCQALYKKPAAKPHKIMKKKG
jgi:hypothetical protein